MGLVEDYAKICTDHKYIESISKALERNVKVTAVIGNVTYHAIREDPYAKGSYEKLISDGARIFFNPEISGKEEIEVSDKKNVRILNRLSGFETVITNSFFTAGKVRRKIAELVENSILLENFDTPVEELREYYEKHSSGISFLA